MLHIGEFVILDVMRLISCTVTPIRQKLTTARHPHKQAVTYMNE